MAEYQIESLKYAGTDIPVSQGLLTLIEDNDAWSLWIITEEGWKAASMGHEAELRVNTTSGKLVTLNGRCTHATENSRYHFEGSGPAGIT